MSDFHGHPNRFHPVFQWRLNIILGELRSLGWKPKVHSEAFRTLEQEKQKVKEGNSETTSSWHVIGNRRWMAHGRSQIDVLFGNAADIIDERWGWDGPAMNPKFKFWTDLGRIAKKYGCEWGGDWKDKHGKPKPDSAHIQFKYIEMPPQSSVNV